jgi:hypothetical protein
VSLRSGKKRSGRYELVTVSGTYDLAVPKKDGELVRHKLGGGVGPTG